MLQYTRQPEHVYLELGEPYKTVLTVATTSMHSTVVVREVFSGLQESCYIIVMVVQEREETHSRTWGVPEAELKSGWEARSPSTEDCSWGCLHASDSAFGYSSPYLHPASPLAT